MACQLLIDLPGLKNASPSKITDRLDGVPPLALHVVHELAAEEELKLPIYQYIKSYRNVQPITSGAELIRMQIAPGPIYRHILGNLRSAWLDGEISSEEEEKQLLKKIIGELNSDVSLSVV